MFLNNFEICIYSLVHNQLGIIMNYRQFSMNSKIKSYNQFSWPEQLASWGELSWNKSHKFSFYFPQKADYNTMQ